MSARNAKPNNYFGQGRIEKLKAEAAARRAAEAMRKATKTRIDIAMVVAKALILAGEKLSNAAHQVGIPVATTYTRLRFDPEVDRLYREREVQLIHRRRQTVSHAA